MAQFKNEQNIQRIKFAQNIQAFCPLGNDWYTNQVIVEFYPDEIIPDYCEVEKHLRNMAGNEMSIEDCVANVLKYMKKYKPTMCKVLSIADDAVHFPVEVEATWYNEFEEEENEN